jgi:periplasmic divalent cation tolerance protein
MSYLLITTTTDNETKAQEIANRLVTQKIAACVQIDKIQSIYTQEKQLQNTTEYRLSIKTQEILYDEVAVMIRTLHNYDTPEIVATVIRYISEDYSEWIDKNTLES